MSNDTAQPSPATATEDASVFVKYPEPTGFKEAVDGTPIVWDPTFMDTLQSRPTVFFTFGADNAARLAVLTGIQFMAIEKRALPIDLPESGRAEERDEIFAKHPELADVVPIIAGIKATFVGPDDVLGLELWQKAAILELAKRLKLGVATETGFVESAVDALDTFKVLLKTMPPDLLKRLAKAQSRPVDMPFDHQSCTASPVQ